MEDSDYSHVVCSGRATVLLLLMLLLLLVLNSGHPGVVYFTLVFLHQLLPLPSSRAKTKFIFALTVPVVVRANRR